MFLQLQIAGGILKALLAANFLLIHSLYPRCTQSDELLINTRLLSVIVCVTSILGTLLMLR